MQVSGFAAGILLAFLTGLSACYGFTCITIKLLKIRTPEKLLYYPKIRTMWLYFRIMRPNDADGIANSVDPDQEQSDLGLHCLPRPSENLGSLRKQTFQRFPISGSSVSI